MRHRRLLAAAGIVIVAATALAACGDEASKATEGGGRDQERLNEIAHDMYDVALDLQKQLDGKQGFDALEELGDDGLATALDDIGDLYDEAAEVDPLYEPSAAGAHEAAAAVRTAGLMGLMSLGEKYDADMNRCEADIQAVSGLQMDGDAL